MVGCEVTDNGLLDRSCGFVYIPFTCWDCSTTVYKLHLYAWYTGVVKNYLKTQQLIIILHGRVSWNGSYKSTLYILIQQILCGYNITEENHSCFNISKQYFSKDIKSDHLVGFHKCNWACENRAYLHKLHMFRKPCVS